MAPTWAASRTATLTPANGTVDANGVVLGTPERAGLRGRAHQWIEWQRLQTAMKEGDLLATLDDRAIRASLDQARAQLGQSRLVLDHQYAHQRPPLRRSNSALRASTSSLTSRPAGSSSLSS